MNARRDGQGWRKPDADQPEAARFDLADFLPYLLNQAAEAASLSFQSLYRADYGMTRAQWRVIAHLGKSGGLTARDICRLTQTEKTKVSRAVSALEARGLLSRAVARDDRRAEILSLTEAGTAVFRSLGARAVAHDASLRKALGSHSAAHLDRALRSLIDLLRQDEGRAGTGRTG